MAKKKTKTRRKRSLSSGGATKRRKSRAGGGRKRSLLSDAMNPTVLMNGGKFTLAAAAGGIAGNHVSKWVAPSATKLQKALVILGIGIAGNIVGFPNMTAGAIGAMTANMFPNGLNDNEANYANENSLADLPLYLDDNGSPMVLEEGESGSNFRYLSDDEIEMMERAGAFDQYEEV